MKCLEKKPEQRFQTAGDLLPAFESFATPSSGVTPAKTPPIQALVPRSPLLRRAVVTGAVILVAGTGLGILSLARDRAVAGADVVRPIQRLAALPPQSLTSDAQPDPLADGLLDALITRLAQLKTPAVVPRSSVLRYRMTQLSTTQIARQLNADGVVEVSIHRSGDRIRVNAQLVDVSGDRALWSQSFDARASDGFALQDSLAQGIASGIRNALPPPVSGRTP